ncbi:hypothetical protein TWF481_001757 [Arthrobotrys musiformis]|uniref:Uncharacterized protein n=1 Tax=Arthrobotrys musiformis TaxID=47236 RepID=A0AAV9VW80_9PEZI
MATTSYLTDTRFQRIVGILESHEHSSILVLWYYLLRLHFPRNNGWYRRHLLSGIEHHHIHSQWRHWEPSPGVSANRCYIMALMCPHDSFDSGRHRKFGDDAREAILQVMTLSPDDEVSEGGHVTIAVASELVVEFWEWTGRQLGRPELRRVTVVDEDWGRIVGPLHVVDDAEKVSRVMRYVRERAESLVDTDGIYLSP